MGRCQCGGILKGLMAMGDIRRVSGFSLGHRAYGYLPGPQYEGQELRTYFPTHPDLLRRLNEVRNLETADAKHYRLPVHDYWEGCQTALSIDRHSARHLLAKLPIRSNRFGVQGMFLEQIATGEYRFKVDKYGRVHNSITSIHKTLRHALRIKGQPIAGVDIVNCQPAMLVLLILNPNFFSGLGLELNEIGKRDSQLTQARPSPNTIPLYYGTPSTPLEGFVEYRDVVTEGQLYEHLADATGLPRKKVKRRLLTDVFGKKRRYKSDVETVFRKMFPGVWNFIRQFNRDNHAALLRELQRVESDLVIRGVGRQLQALGCDACISLHDGIYCQRSQLGDVQSAFEREFESIGFRMKLKIKEKRGL
jgi:hypothetical protein